MPSLESNRQMLLALVAVDKGDEMTTLRLKPATQTDTVTFRQANDWKDTTAIGDGLVGKMQRAIKKASGNVRLQRSERDVLLEEFIYLGTLAWVRLLGFYRSSTVYLGPGTLEPNAPVSVEVDCPNDLILPLELLPILSPTPSLRTVGDRPLFESARMVGIGAQSHRTIRHSRRFEEGHLDKGSARFYWHTKLRGARHEWQCFQRNFGEGALGPHPAVQTTKPDLFDWLISKPGREGKTFPAAVEHFACHHTQGSGEDSDRVRLRARGWRAKETSFSADDMAVQSNGKPPRAGLVFINACSTQVVFSAADSVVREFYGCGRSAIVATWCDVPDLVAAKMSEFFYEEFCKGAAVGAALRVARLRLLLEYNNPLGLLYTVYGDSDYALG